MRTYQPATVSNLGLPADSYVYTIVPTSAQDNPRSRSFPTLKSSDHIIAVSSDASIRTLDPETLKVVNAIQNAHSSFDTIKRYATPGTQCTTFMTCGRDGFVRGWDLRTSSKVLEFSSPKGQPLTALDCDAELQAVFAGTEVEGDAPGDTAIYGWDVRMPGSDVKIKYEESHSDTVTELRFLPTMGDTKTLLLSAGLDGMVNIFDTKVAEEDDAIVQAIRSDSALQHSGLIDGDIYTLGTDETLAFHAFSNPNIEAQDPASCSLGDVREQFACEYVVNLYEAGSKPYLAVGNHTEQWLDLIRFKNKASSPSDTRSWKPKSTDESRIRLHGGHGEELVRDVLIPEGAGVVYTCGEDGIVRVWKAEDEDVDMGGTSKVGKKRKAEKSERRGKKSKD